MPLAPVADHEIYYERFGEPDDPCLVLISGLGTQLLSWPEELCQGFVDRMFSVIRFDNRDTGLSSDFSGRPPYGLCDMAADVVGLLDHLGVDRAHVVGMSMGGMIAQLVAIEHPDRVASLTSIASTTGEADVGQSTAEAFAALTEAPSGSRDEIIDATVAARRIWATPSEFDEEAVRAVVAAAYDRAYRPDGVARQMAAVGTASDRTEGLRSIGAPALVVHGAADTLVAVDGGERTAELIPDAELLVIDEMGHDLPPLFWAPIIEGVTRLAAQAS